MNVSACLVTDGKHDMQEVCESLPAEWEIVIWNNGDGVVYRWGADGSFLMHSGRVDLEATRASGEYTVAHFPDLSVYGRYAAIEYASHDLIYVQDDDVIVSDPQTIVDRWEQVQHIATTMLVDDDYDDREVAGLAPEQCVVCNMPQEFRPHYPDAALVGFGACFHRDAPKLAFERFRSFLLGETAEEQWHSMTRALPERVKQFHRECDRVFTVLAHRVLVDVPKMDREFASDPDRLWRQPDHHASTQRMLEMARKVRDA